jgi:hypothetical protein
MHALDHLLASPGRSVPLAVARRSTKLGTPLSVPTIACGEGAEIHGRRLLTQINKTTKIAKTSIDIREIQSIVFVIFAV